MNRRDFLAGSIALAGQHHLLHSMDLSSIMEPGSLPVGSPQDLLSTTLPDSLLESRLSDPGLRNN